MRFSISLTVVIGLLFLMVGSLVTADAQTLARGPYLQTGTPDSIIVKWRTALADSAIDTVHYGTAQDSLTSSAVSNAVTVDCGGSCNLLEHESLLTGLIPNTRYYYAIGTASGPLAENSAKGSFVTSPVADAAQPTRIWVIGDSGTADANALAVRDAFKSFSQSREANLWLMLGDNAYPDGTDSQYQSAVFDMYPELLRNTPLWATLGNHDGHSADSGNQSGPYYDIFAFPTNAEAGGVASGTEAYYSFNYGNIHFICLDSYDTDRSLGQPMLTWLENDLLSTTQEWIIAFWHHPPYSKGSHDSDSESSLVQMRENVLPLLESYGVDLVLSGHSHSYERSYLLDGHYGSSSELNDDPNLNPSLILDPGNGRPLPEAGADGAYSKDYSNDVIHKGAVYAVAGSSGKVTLNTPLNHPAMYISLEKLGSMVLDIYGDRMDASFIGLDGTVQDNFTVVHDPETFPPAILMAQAIDATTVAVLFTEPLDSVTAQDTNNYSIDGGIVASNAVLGADFRTVTLTTSPLSVGTSYTLTVVNVQDYRAGLAIPPPGIQASFSLTVVITRSFKNGVAPSSGYAGTLDSYIRETDPNANYGNETKLLADGSDAGSGGVKGQLAALISWDLSDIPAGSTIESAAVKIDVFNSTSGLYDLFEMRTPWNESTVTWASNGAIGDRGTTVLGTASASQTGFHTIALNSDGISLIQSWLEGSIANRGFILVNRQTTDGIDFWSSEAALASRPELIISYAPASGSGSGNLAPLVDAIADQSVDEGAGLTVPVSASDPDGDALTLTASGVPIFATFTDNGNGTGQLDAAPGFGDAGTYPVTVTAKDPGGLSNSNSFTITVVGKNPPILDAIADQSVDEGAGLTVPVSASDPDGDALTLTASGVPIFATFTDNGNGTGQLDAAPGFNDAGTYTVTVTATDTAGLFHALSFLLIVVDRPLPALHIQDVTLQIKKAPKKMIYATAQVAVQDELGQPVSNAAVSVQWSGDFDQSTANGVTDANGVAVFNSVQVQRTATGQFIFNVLDVSKNNFLYDSSTDIENGGCIDTSGVSCSTDPGNNPPALNPISDYFVVVNDIATVPLSATDADFGDSLTLTVLPGSPAFVTLQDNGGGSGELTIAPVAGDAGDHTVTVRVEDSSGLSDSQTFSLTVTDTAAVMQVPSPFQVNITGRGGNTRARGTVQVVVEGSSTPVDNAVLEGSWEVIPSGGGSISLGSIAGGTTDGSGVVAITSDKYRAKSGDVFRLTITSVTRQGFNYDSQALPKPYGEAQVN